MGGADLEVTVVCLFGQKRSLVKVTMEVERADLHWVGLLLVIKLSVGGWLVLSSCRKKAVQVAC